MIKDSGFYVIKVILKMGERGVYRIALIKNKHYWTKEINGDGINKYLK